MLHPNSDTQALPILVPLSIKVIDWQKKLNRLQKDSLHRGDYGQLHEFCSSLKPVLAVNSE